uniref:Uncharacterized protein n=1 Tax=Tetranychus urticae TaxID=32264 RepID=T1KI35_TETUR
MSQLGESVRILLDYLRAERLGWVSCQGLVRRPELIVYNMPNLQHNRDLDTRELLIPVLELLPEWQAKIFYIQYRRGFVIIGFRQLSHKAQTRRLLRSHLPDFSFRNVVPHQANIYFFLKLSDGETGPEDLTEDIILQNDLIYDLVTKVTLVQLKIRNIYRVTLNISAQNREILLSRDGFLSWRSGVVRIYDGIGLTACMKCCSFSHATRNCANPVCCFICGGNHYRNCPSRLLPVPRCCVSCRGMSLVGNNLIEITRSILEMNELYSDDTTKVVSIDRTSGKIFRVTLEISERNRERLLDRDGLLSWRSGSVRVYDDIGLNYCTRCCSFNHLAADCRNNIRCSVCREPHLTDCPFIFFPVKHVCASCDDFNCGTHVTFSPQCPSLQARIHREVRYFNIKYNWVLVPHNPALY